MRRWSAPLVALAVGAITTLFGANPALAQEPACGQTINDHTNQALLKPHTDALLTAIKPLEKRGVTVRIIAVQSLRTDDIAGVKSEYVRDCPAWQTHDDGQMYLEDHTLVIVWAAAVNNDTSQRRVGIFVGRELQGLQEGLDGGTLTDIREEVTPTLLRYSAEQDGSWHFVADGIEQILTKTEAEMHSAKVVFWVLMIVIFIVILVVIGLVVYAARGGGGGGGSSSSFIYVSGGDGGGGGSTGATSGAC